MIRQIKTIFAEKMLKKECLNQKPDRQ